MIVGEIVRVEIEKRFGPDAERLLRLFETTALPYLDDPEREGERDRVHLAVLKVANGRVPELKSALALASMDWRDLLIEAGMANENWADVLRAAGYPVP